MKQRAAVLIVNNEQLLLVRREKEGRQYFVLPGGGVEDGETPEAACLREAREETGLTIVLQEKLGTLVNQGRLEHCFLAASYQGELQLGGPELERQSDTNLYRLEWVDADRLEEINLLPGEIRPLCRDCLRPR